MHISMRNRIYLIEYKGGIRMGSYSNQYENYYSKLRKNTYGTLKVNSQRSNKSKKKNGLVDFTLGSIVKTVIVQLIVVLILITALTICKTDIVPEGKIAYEWFKSSIDKNIEYEAVVARVSNIKVGDFEEKFQDVFEKIREGLTGEETTKAFIKNNFNFNLDAEKQIVSVYNGTVKNIGTDTLGNKYVVINHGKGIETRYTNLLDIYVEKDDVISKGMSIGSYINDIDYHNQIELLYMGRSLDYTEYVSE